MFILGIESSCDDTSAAVVKDGFDVLSNVVSSQIETHKKYGGVVPEIASRKHIENISGVIDAALIGSGTTLRDLDAIAVTCGPGLVGALLVGVAYAKGLAFALNKPLIGVQHIEGHISAVYLDYPELAPGFMTLVVSGGHTQLVVSQGFGEYSVLGRTRDDAAGEAYDKIARALGLGYPGGPAIDLLAHEGNPLAIDFPRVMLEAGSFDFSFSGLKSAVLNYLNRFGHECVRADVAASFQQAVVDVLVEKAMSACRAQHIPTLTLAGGVSCNTALRRALTAACQQNDIRLYVPRPEYCTDNAAMIAAAGYFKFNKKSFSGLDLNAYPSLAM